MALADSVRPALEATLGHGFTVRETLVAHHERRVLDLVLPDGRRAVVKVDAVAARAAVEADVLRAAADAGVPVPEVLGFEPGPPSVLVLSYVAGDWLSPERSERAWRAAGAVLRRIHELPLPGDVASWHARVGQWIDERREAAAGLGLATHRIDHLVRELDLLLVDGQPAERTLHGDAMPIHFRLSGDSVVGVLDFGDTTPGDPVFDLAVLTLWSPDRLDAVLDGYGAGEELRHWAGRVLPVYRSLRFLLEATWLAGHGYDPETAVHAFRR